jgi:CheY-like chemotaxis protein
MRKFEAMPARSGLPLILLVEDSEDDAYFFRRILKHSGIQCNLVHVDDGAAALDALEQAKFRTEHRPGLIFLDLKLPTYDGFEILQWIRDQQFDPPMEVAVLSGSEHDVDISRAKSLGAKHYFAKPLSVEQLRTALRKIVDEDAGLSRSNA